MWSKIFKKRLTSPSSREPDMLLLVATLALVAFGTVMIYSSSSLMALEKFKDGEFFIKKQVFFVTIGMVSMVLFSKIHFTMWRKLAYPILLVSVLLLCLLLIPGFGVRAGGATRWLRMGIVSIQVSELAKVAMVIFLADYLSRRWNHLSEIKLPFFIPLLVTGLVAFLIFRQPDYGTAVLIALITLIMLFLAGIKMRYLLSILALFIPLAILLLFMKGYRVERLVSYLDPWKDPLKSGFQIIQSFISFGSGGATGVGLGGGIQKLFYLPEPHTDFILAIIAEESGLVGVVMVIGLYAILIHRGLAISYRMEDFFGNLLAAGLTLVVAFGVMINIFGVMGLIPLKGIALPFLSYGGSSLLMSMVAVGILLNISRHCPR